MASATSEVRSRPTTPRMSYSRKMVGLTRTFIARRASRNVVLRSAGPSQPARTSFVPKFYVASRIRPDHDRRPHAQPTTRAARADLWRPYYDAQTRTHITNHKYTSRPPALGVAATLPMTVVTGPTR